MSCCYCFPSCRCLHPTEQMVLESFTQVSVINGPGCYCVGPCKRGHRREALIMQANNYAVILDKAAGDRRVAQGPQTYFMGPYEETLNGRSHASTAITLGTLDYLIVENKKSGARQLKLGPAQWVPTDPFDEPVGNALTAVTLGPTQYIHVQNQTDGSLSLVKGPAVWIPSSPFETIRGEVREAISLKNNEYVRIMDTQTGQIRVERGESVAFLIPTEVCINAEGKRVEKDHKNVIEKAVNIDSMTAVLVRNTKSGQVDLVTKRGLYFPTPYEVVESVQKKIILKDQHTVILRDQIGTFHFKTGGKSTGGAAPTDANTLRTGYTSAPAPAQDEGNFPQPAEDSKADMKKSRKAKGKERAAAADDEVKVDADVEVDRAFFVPPFWEIVELNWSVGPYKDEKRAISVIDQRPHQMTYIFNVRTADSVELEIDVSFYWQIIDLPKMVVRTSDPTGDISYHARSVVSAAVSKLTLDKFLHSFNVIVSSAVLDPADDFYETRGLKIHNCEMRALKCRDETTQGILQQIIAETTHRLNRLQKQTSDNEVAVLEIKGTIEKEKMSGELMKIKLDNRRIAAITEGEAEAAQVAAFFAKFGSDKLDAQRAFDIWNALRRKESIQSLSTGNAQLYVTPDGVNLSVGSFGGPNPRSK